MKSGCSTERDPLRSVFVMSEKRHERQREQRKFNRREEKLDTKNIFGITDRVPREAIDRIIGDMKLVKNNDR